MNRDAVRSIEEVWGLMPKGRLPYQDQVLTVDESLRHAPNRVKYEMRTTGRIFIPREFALDAPLIQWIRRMEDMMGWRIFASPEHLREIGPSALPNERRGNA